MKWLPAAFLPVVGRGQVGAPVETGVPEKTPGYVKFLSAMSFPNPIATVSEEGDFTLYDDNGKELVVLKRGVRGDPIHERFATILLRTATNQYDLKDWRDWRLAK